MRKNLQVFMQAGIETIRWRLAMKIYDEYANILRGMFSGESTVAFPTEMRLRLKTRPVEPPRDHSPHH